MPTVVSLATAADVLASSTRSSSSSSPVAVDESVEEAVHIVEESLHERAAVSRRREGGVGVLFGVKGRGVPGALIEMRKGGGPQGSDSGRRATP